MKRYQSWSCGSQTQEIVVVVAVWRQFSRQGSVKDMRQIQPSSNEVKCLLKGSSTGIAAVVVRVGMVGVV